MRLIIDTNNVITTSDKLFRYFFLEKRFLFDYDYPRYIKAELENRLRLRIVKNTDGNITFSMVDNL